MHEPKVTVPVERCSEGLVEQIDDHVAVEEPCEIRLGGESVAVVMRTPGHDRELAAGFLFSEGIVKSGDIGSIRACADPDVLNPENIVEVRLVPGVEPAGDWDRNFYASSSCGVCGKASIDAIHVLAPALKDPTTFRREHIAAAVPALRGMQTVFSATGGLHAAGLFSGDGELILVREDVGRHNAVDKVIGYAYTHDLLPLNGHMLVVSGRQSFEIVQKAAVAQVPLVGGVSAASSLAIELARDKSMTLVGFVRGASMVAYAGAERLI
ncbi:MAG TPA: formate dehydrogenase accessory sulfurtransferase FdhD [Acidobacteriota bacterium]|nr:formate dehydrogenase accessory sulfurtransferase FdhD [Acidobacteriota bacterium]